MEGNTVTIFKYIYIGKTSCKYTQYRHAYKNETNLIWFNCYHGINKIYVLVITLALKSYNSVNYTVKWYTLDLKLNMLPTVLELFEKFYLCKNVYHIHDMIVL